MLSRQEQLALVLKKIATDGCILGLHTDPPVDFKQETGETNYLNYSRFKTNPEDWSVAETTFSNNKCFVFPESAGENNDQKQIRYLSYADDIGNVLCYDSLYIPLKASRGISLNFPTNCIGSAEDGPSFKINPDIETIITLQSGPATCLKCGYVNEYIGAHKDYLCTQCKLWERIA